jgi:hypothetical protein
MKESNEFQASLSQPKCKFLLCRDPRMANEARAAITKGVNKNGGYLAITSDG